MVIPPKLKKGDEIRVVAPSSSLATASPATRKLAEQKLKKMGFRLSFGKHVDEKDAFDSSSVQSRLEDLHDAFADKKVKMVWCARGGYNANQLLPFLDYRLIGQQPKILSGYSDITALANAIFTKTGLVTYSGPNFTTMAMKKGAEYPMEYFEKSLRQSRPYDVVPSKRWSDDPWSKDQVKRVFHKNNGYLLAQEGKAEGTIIGGNLCTLNLLHGTSWMPSLKETILFLEDDALAGDHTMKEFDRNLVSLLQQPGSAGIKGIVFGRFQKASKATDDLILKMIQNKPEIRHLPIIANADFGHTDQQFTFPIGGTARLIVKDGKTQLSILKH